MTPPTPVRARYFSTIAGRRTARQALIVAGAFLLGYLVTVFWIFPAPIFSSDHAVDRVLDQGVTAARTRLEQQGFRPAIGDQQTDPTIPKGAVVWQDPPPGTVLPPNSAITLTLSEGPPDVPVPDVAAFPRTLAEHVLTAAGFRIGSVESLPAPSDPETIVSTRPGPGVGRPAGTAIDLVLSSGPAELSVPDVVGRPLAEARDLLQGAGLEVGAVGSRVITGRPPGLVVEQHPAPGTRSSKGQRVDLIVTRKVN
jgi:serine/threonine-protein kinase